MKMIHTVTTPAVLILAALAPAWAAPKTQSDLQSEARNLLEQVDQTASRVSETAFDLHRFAYARPSSDLEIQRLDSLKIDVNNMNRDIQRLEQERASLTPWEAKTLDEILPRVHEIGLNAEGALRTYNEGLRGLFATSFPAQTETIVQDADQVSSVVHQHLKLAKAQAEESQLEQRLGE